jgi:hypothetical protein
MNRIENMPDEVFDWIKTHAFERLSSAQQQTVLAYITRTDYNDMHVAYTSIIKINNNKNSRKELIKESLLEQFEIKHQPTKLKNVSRNNVFWKVAAVFLAIGFPLTTYYLMKSQQHGLSSQFSNRIDTVYLDNNVKTESVKVYDTIYITRETPLHKAQNEQAVTPHPDAHLPVDAQINLLHVNDIDADINRTKRNSIKDDNLINSFSFVTL